MLLRQCLRALPERSIRAGPTDRGTENELQSVGISRDLSGYLQAEPFRPAWLEESGQVPVVDLPAMAFAFDESVPAEEWLLRTCGNASWRSSTQKEACWSVLQTKVGQTTLIGLPTGAGKSLLFQVLSAFTNGLTVVVVPTVALGLDQLGNAKRLPVARSLNPQLYSAGPDSEEVRALVASRSCRLLFTSPEAVVSGRLRELLRKHAEEGWLKNLVVDEAHIVESWGADFRIEFQLLGSVVSEWRRLSNDSLVVVLLSATFGRSALDVLRSIFSPDGRQQKDVIVQRLRPEIHYFMARAASKEIRDLWVWESLRFLPRPLILYVTEKDDAETWYRSLLSSSFNRVAIFHGDTSEIDRKNRLRDWKEDRLDVMIATSAFGMGVDKSDVRAVIHACFPESIDRFYQEVGRGGRDGAAITSLLLSTREDEHVGRQLIPRLLRPETISARWDALWKSRKPGSSSLGTFLVRSDARQVGFFGARSYDENIRWNKRLLQMLQRTRLLKIVGAQWEQDLGGEYVEWLEITTPQFSTVGAEIGALVEPARNNELTTLYAGHTALKRCLEGVEPVCRELRTYYGGEVTRICGSCSYCRTDREQRVGFRRLQWPLESENTSPRVEIVPMPPLARAATRGVWVLAIRRTLDEGIAARFLVDKEDQAVVRALLQIACGSGEPRLYRLDTHNGRDQIYTPANEHVVALHPNEFRQSLGVANVVGRISTHWINQTQILDPQGRWRFMHDHNSQLRNDLDQWLTHMRRFQAH